MKRALISLLLAAALLLGGCGAMAPSDYAKSADLAVDEANAVSYTHLDVYKRQICDRRELFVWTLPLSLYRPGFSTLAP